MPAALRRNRGRKPDACMIGSQDATISPTRCQLNGTVSKAPDNKSNPKVVKSR